MPSSSILLRALGLGTASLALATLVPAAPASAATTPPHGVDPARFLWATINVCDTPGHPSAIGLRASMPGVADAGVEMYMRFQAQFFNPKDGVWHSLSNGGDSGFVDAGSGRFRARETGRLFTFAPPTGSSFQLRGIVSFEWRRGARVIRSVKRRTTTGHPSASGADPVGFSAATCVIG